MSEEQKPEAKPLTLAQKILAIQNSVGVVHKKGKNKEQNYDYLRIEEAVVSVNKLMVEKDLLLTQTLQKKPDSTFYFERQPHKVDKGYMVSVVLEWTLEDVSTGDKRTYDIPGEGYDSTDKGTPKAITSSRKQAIITIFNLPVGNDIEERGAVDRETAKASAKAVGDKKVTLMAAAGSQGAIDALSQVVPEKKIHISRPEEHNGNFIVVTGFIAAPPLERFFDDTNSKRFKTKLDLVPYWRVPSEYEKGLVQLCQKLEIEVEG
jgi:ERF superfamily